MTRYRGFLLLILAGLFWGLGPAAGCLARLRLNLTLVQCFHNVGGPTSVCWNLLDVSDERTRYQHGVNALRAGMTQQAVELLSDHLYSDPRDSAARFYLGMAYLQNGDRIAALSSWREDKAAPYFLGRGKRHNDPNDIETAIAIGPATPEMYFSLGEVYRGLGRVSDATMAYQKYLAKSSPQAMEHWLAMGYVRSGLGELAEALQAFQNAAALNPRALIPLYRVAETSARLGQYAFALEIYQKIQRLAPAEEFAYLGAAEAGLALGNISSAVQILEQADRKFPGSGRASAALGALFVQKDELETAIRHLKEAVRRDPTVVWMQMQLGEALMRHGDRLGAIRVYQQALVLAPDDATIKQKLAKLETPK